MTKYKIQNGLWQNTKQWHLVTSQTTANCISRCPRKKLWARIRSQTATADWVDIGCQLLSSSLSSSSSPTLSSSLLDFFHHHWWSSKGFELNSFFPFPRELALIASLLAVVQWKRWRLSGIAKRQRSYLGMWLLWAPPNLLPPPTRFTQISTLPIVTLEALINFLLEIIIIDIF